MTSGLLLIIVLVCKALGGWYFLAAQFCGFTAIIQLLHGTGVAVAVSMQKSHGIPWNRVVLFSLAWQHFAPPACKRVLLGAFHSVRLHLVCFDQGFVLHSDTDINDMQSGAENNEQVSASVSETVKFHCRN